MITVDTQLLKAARTHGLPLREAEVQAEDGELTPLGIRLVADLARLVTSRFGDAPVTLEDAARHTDIITLTRKLSAARDLVVDLLRHPGTRAELA